MDENLEKLEDVKLSLMNSEDIQDIAENPVCKMVFSLVSKFPALGALVESATQNSLMMFQEKKREELCEIIFSDGKITKDMVKDVRFIMEFEKLLDTVNRLTTNTKVEYLGKLFRNAVLSGEESEYDKFEERLSRFNELSNREIEMLYLMYGCQRDGAAITFPKENMNGKLLRIWEDFVKIASKKYGVSKGEVESVISGITRTGFCKPYYAEIEGKSKIIYRVTDSYSEFLEDVKK